MKHRPAFLTTFVLILAAIGLVFCVSPVYAQTPSDLTDDLVSCWDLDEGSGTREDAYGVNDLTDVNTVGRVAGVDGYAANFVVANNEVLSIADPFHLGGDFTIAGWASLDDSGPVFIAIKWHEFLLGRYAPYARLYVSDDGVSWSHNANYNAAYVSGFDLLVGWYDSTAETISFSLNNETPSSVSFTGTIPDGSNSFNIGGGGASNGSVDTVVIWERVLSSNDRTWLYNSGEGRSCQDIIDTGLAPTPTPAGAYLGSLSSGDFYTLDYTVTAGDLIVIGGLVVMLIVIILGLGSVIFKQWLA